MSKRDIIALVALLILMCVFVPVYFVTIPEYNDSKTLQVTLDGLEKQKADFLINEIEFPKQVAEFESLQASINKIKADLPDFSKSYNSHYAFSEMAKKNEVSIKDLEIGELVLYQTEEEKQKIKDAATAVKDEEVIPLPSVQTYVLNIKLNVLGELDNIIKLTDDINSFNNNISINELVVGEKIETGVNADITVGIYVLLSNVEAGVTK